jgi:hypothetical protein
MTTICGGVALQAGFLVAFKQLVPEHTVTIAKGIIRVRVKVRIEYIPPVLHPRKRVKSKLHIILANRISPPSSS